MVYVDGQWILRDHFESSATLGTYYKPTGEIADALNALIDHVVAFSPAEYQANTRYAMRALFIDDAKYLFVDNLDCELLTFYARTGQTNISDSDRKVLRRDGNSLIPSEPYGCTFDDISYLGKRELKKLKNIKEKALAMIHERLHALRPYRSELGNSVIAYYHPDSGASGDIKGYSYYPKLSQNFHLWITPFTVGAARALSSDLDPAVRADAQNIELLKSVSARVCLTYFDSGCSETNMYDPAEQSKKQNIGYFDHIFRRGFKTNRLRLKHDLVLSGSGDVLGSLGEHCLLKGPLSYESSVTLKKGTEFTTNFSEGAILGAAYFPSLGLIDNSDSTKYEVICETAVTEYAIIRVVQEIRSEFDPVP